MCEASERNQQAVFELEKMAGSWVFDIGHLKQILTGASCTHEEAAA